MGANRLAWWIVRGLVWESSVVFGVGSFDVLRIRGRGRREGREEEKSKKASDGRKAYTRDSIDIVYR